MTNYRIDNPRRNYPTVRIFHDFNLIVETDIHQEDVPAVRSYLAAHIDEIEYAAYPAATARRIMAEALA